MHKILGLQETKLLDGSNEDYLRQLIKKAQEVVLNKSTEASGLNLQES